MRVTINSGFENLIPVLDNKEELEYYNKHVRKKCNIGLRIAAEEEPTFEFYTSRLGIRYRDMSTFFTRKDSRNPKIHLKMLHFFY